MKLWLDDLRPVPYGYEGGDPYGQPGGRANMERILTRYWGEQYW